MELRVAAVGNSGAQEVRIPPAKFSSVERIALI